MSRLDRSEARACDSEAYIAGITVPCKIVGAVRAHDPAAAAAD
jgi:hypothetical protein